ncbi:recombinase family protein [Sphingobium yanoikuyae]|uniref:recombinase family protein n=1 Tax=Sphingobium yanoikuyae TaxID=13690 RepID=UPI003A5BC1EA
MPTFAESSVPVDTAVYARFSTNLQNDKSTADQIAVCRKYALNEGMTVVKTFEDKAKSGASMHNRDGLLRLLDFAMGGDCDVIIVEHLDRLSRDMEDMAGMFKRLKHMGIRLMEVGSGEANTLTVGMKAMFAQMFREENVHKVKRGMHGLIQRGLAAGGQAYGYRPDPQQKGRYVRADDELAVVLRIFQEYSAGVSPAKIARALNAEHIRPPRNTLWSPSTLVGEASRGSGILRNPIYVGRIVWNKNRMIKDPDTGNRLSRPNPPEEWVVTEQDDLRIMPDELFEAVQEQLTSRSSGPLIDKARRERRPKRLLSGLLKCSACGSGMSTSGKDKSGKTRLRCSAHVNSGSCPAPKTYYLENVERLVLNSLLGHLHHPELIESFVAEYQAERRKLNADKHSRIGELQNRINFLDKDNDRLLDWARRDLGDPVKLLTQMKEQAQEIDRLKVELGNCEEPDNKVDLHPAAIKRYAKGITTARELYETAQLDGSGEHADIVRELITQVVVMPNDISPLGLEIEVSVRFEPFGYKEGQPRRAGLAAATAYRGVKGVAEEGLEPPTRGL